MIIKDAYKYNILLVDDYPPVRRMVKEIIEENPDLRVIGELNDGRELLKFLKKSPAHLILLDISMPNLGGFEATLKVKQDHPDVKILILTIHKYREYAERAMSLGAEGYLLKEEVGDSLLPAINSLRQGGTFISPGLAV
ncbi:MAG: response regulator transcription factor [Deltaproteobacteria bacterium]|nr:response regulator transcription factor [Deltaproteobacteria bacterium]